MNQEHTTAFLEMCPTHQEGEQAVKACPFCGRDGLMLATHDECWIECDAVDCDARSGTKDTPEEAVAAWNRRAVPHPTQSERDQVLEEAIEACNAVRVEHFLAKQQYASGSAEWLDHRSQAISARKCMDAIRALKKGAE